MVALEWSGGQAAGAVVSMLRPVRPPFLSFVRMQPVGRVRQETRWMTERQRAALGNGVGQTPNATRDVVVLNDFGEASPLWKKNATWSRAENGRSLYAGRVENRSPFLYRVVVRGHYLSSVGQPVGVALVTEDAITPGETRGIRFTFPGDAQTIDHLEIRGVGCPTPANKQATVLLLVFLALVTHVCVAGWLHPKGWERRLLWLLSRRYPLP